MPVIDITNPDVIKFLIESYDKTARLRMKWNNLHKDGLLHAATLHREAKGYHESDVIKANMAACMPMTTRDNIVAGTNRRKKPIRDGTHIPGISELKKGHSIPAVGLGDVKHDPRLARPDTDLAPDPKMRLMDPKQRRIIYKDIPTFGRKAYLKSRNKMAPEDKFYFRESSGWEYGWRLKDSYFSGHAPTYGRVWRLTRDQRSLTGPQPDPPHYKSSEIPGPAKCVANF